MAVTIHDVADRIRVRFLSDKYERPCFYLMPSDTELTEIPATYSPSVSALRRPARVWPELEVPRCSRGGGYVHVILEAMPAEEADRRHGPLEAFNAYRTDWSRADAATRREAAAIKAFYSFPWAAVPPPCTRTGRLTMRPKGTGLATRSWLLST